MLGDITEVWAYTDRVNAMGHRPKPEDPPKDMDWNSWCGPAELCGYYGPQKPKLFGLHPHDWHSWQKLGNGSIGNMGTHVMDAPFWFGLHPHDWHSWQKLGNGSIGNMGTHVMDAPFWALNLGAAHPTSIYCTHADIVAEGSWSIRTEMEYEFPAVGNRGPVKMHWTDGLRYGLDYEAADLSNYGYARAGRKDHNMPEIMHKLERDYHLEKAPFPTNGAFFKGTKGYAWYGQHSMVRFFPKSLGQDIRKFQVHGRERHRPHGRVLQGDPRGPSGEHGVRVLRAARRDRPPRQRGHPRRRQEAAVGRHAHYQRRGLRRPPRSDLPQGLGAGSVR